MRPWRAAVIILAGVALGLLFNAVSDRGVPLTANAFLREGDEEIEAAKAKTRFDRGALFLDARPRDFYNMSHVPGAESLPEDGFDAAFARLEPLLRTRFDMVVYCSGFGCEASHAVAHRLKEKGIHAAILHEGLPAWEEAHYPLKTGPEP